MNIKSIYWEITDVCNLHCKHCYNASTNHNHYFTNIRKIEEIINELANLGCKQVAISGGEPLLHPHIDDIINLLCERDIVPVLITNATLMSEHFLNKVQNKKILYQISIESCYDFENDYIRGKGNLQNLKDTLYLLQKKKQIDRVTLHQTPTAINYKHVCELVAYAKRMGCKGISFSQWTPIGRSADFIDEFSMTSRQAMEFFGLISKAALLYEDDMFTVGRVGVVGRCPLLEEGEVSISPYISNIGYVYCCSTFCMPQFSLGNINMESITHILTENKVKQVMQNALISIKGCNTCTLEKVCGHGCIALATTKRFENDGFCEIRKKEVLSILKEKSYE